MGDGALHQDWDGVPGWGLDPCCVLARVHPQSVIITIMPDQGY